MDQTPHGDDFNYLKPERTCIDRKYQVPLIDIRFDGWYENSGGLWPKHTEQREKFLFLERTPLSSPNISLSSDSGIGTFI